MWTYLNPSKNHRNEILFYNIIYNHYLGPINIYHMAAGTEKKLAQCTYTGKKINCTLDKCSILHKEQHNILNSLKEHGYTGINQQSKVRYLSEFIKTTSLYSAKTYITSDESLRQDFDGCVKLNKYFVKQSITDDRQSLGIAASITNNSSGNKSVTFSP